PGQRRRFAVADKHDPEPEPTGLWSAPLCTLLQVAALRPHDGSGRVLPLFCHSSGRCLDKLDQVIDFRPASQIRFNHFNSLCGIKLRAQEVAVSTLDPLYLIAGEPVPAETNRIRSIAPRMVAYCSSIGQGVFHHNRRCSYECFAPYTAELVNAG